MRGHEDGWRAVWRSGWAALLLGVVGCGGDTKDAETDAGAVRGAEGTEVGDCTDRADNDGDGAFDCDDTGCAGSPDCEGAGDGADDSDDVVDADDDGVPAEADCDDADPALGVQVDDRDCDGVSYADDCDDLDSAAGDRAEDGDCDGVPTAADCDDASTDRGDRGLDGDCDGVVRANDCDDDDAGLGDATADRDCDGAMVLTDCDDFDPTVGDRAADWDCDGATFEIDCDDYNRDSTTTDEDADCDTILADIDCDDLDAATGAIPDDADCDGELETGWGASFARVEGGTFDIWCTPGQREFPEEWNYDGHCSPSALGAIDPPVQSVTLTKATWWQTTEVTEAQFEAVMGYLTSPWSSSGYTLQEDLCLTGACPVSRELSWDEAAAFANEASRQAGLSECYSCIGVRYCAPAVSPVECDGYRLPTEAEYEVAARCGLDTLYAGSDDPEFYAWHTGPLSGGLGNQDWRLAVMPVAELRPNACGLFDMSGNVAEWSGDAYEALVVSGGRMPAETDRYRPGGLQNVARGYSPWQGAEISARIQARAAFLRGTGGSRIGFRLVRTVME
jgi:formylglycine-generating enzyme required for sulfatase activity